MELKQGAVTAVTVKDATQGLVTAMIADVRPGVIDKDGDAYAEGAVRPGRALVSEWQHSSVTTGGRLPVGMASVSVRGGELIAEVEYFMDVPAARQAFEVVKRVTNVQWSWLLDIKNEEYGRVGNRTARIIRDVAALEVSPVVAGAGVGTRTIEARSAQVDFMRDVRARVFGDAEPRGELQHAELRAIRERLEL